MSQVSLPSGWINLKFTDILDVQGGTQPPKSEFISEKQDGYIRLLQIRDFGKKPVPTFIPESKKLKKCSKQDLLIGRYGASLGRICTGQEGAYNVALAKVIYPKEIFLSYIRYYLESEEFQSPLRLLSRSAQNGFNKEDLSKFIFLLPPYAEQKIIADKLDDLLARVESIKTRLENIPEILKKFRQSVLSAAVSGKLTEEWRCQNSTSLEDWKYLSLSNIVSNIEAGKNIKCIEVPPKDNEVGIIKISAVTWGKYDEEESKTLEDDSLFIESRRICVGDFLISRANTLELLGNPVIVHSVTRNLMLSDKVLRLIMPDEDKLWVSIFLRSSVGRKEIESRSTGNQLSMRNIGQKSLLAIPLPYPESDEKREIVKKVEAFLTYAENIENQSYDVLSKIKNLTQSILAKAFRGELTAQWREENPELISGINSAEALLEKITAEKLAAGTIKKRAKKSSH